MTCLAVLRAVIDQYYMGFTMRFPRAMSIRDDLTVADCMTASGRLQ
jgi:DNA ligase-4